MIYSHLNCFLSCICLICIKAKLRFVAVLKVSCKWRKLGWFSWRSFRLHSHTVYSMLRGLKLLCISCVIMNPTKSRQVFSSNTFVFIETNALMIVFSLCCNILFYIIVFSWKESFLKFFHLMLCIFFFLLQTVQSDLTYVKSSCSSSHSLPFRLYILSLSCTFHEIIFRVIVFKGPLLDFLTIKLWFPD